MPANGSRGGTTCKAANEPNPASGRGSISISTFDLWTVMDFVYIIIADRATQSPPVFWLHFSARRSPDCLGSRLNSKRCPRLYLGKWIANSDLSEKKASVESRGLEGRGNSGGLVALAPACNGTRRFIGPLNDLRIGEHERAP